MVPHHILDPNAGEALQSALTFTSGIFKHSPRRLHGSIFPGDSNISSTRSHGLNRRIGPAALMTPPHQPGSAPPGHILSSYASTTRRHSAHLSSIKHKINVTISNTPHLILAFISTSTLTWKQIRETYGATCIANIPPGCIPWGHATGWPDSDVIELDKNAQIPKQTHTW